MSSKRHRRVTEEKTDKIIISFAMHFDGAPKGRRHHLRVNEEITDKIIIRFSVPFDGFTEGSSKGH